MQDWTLDIWVYHRQQLQSLQHSFSALQKALERAAMQGLSVRKVVIWDDGSPFYESLELENWWIKERAVWNSGLLLKRHALSKGYQSMLKEALQDDSPLLMCMDASLKILESAFHVWAQSLQKQNSTKKIQWVPYHVNQSYENQWIEAPERHVSQQVQLYSGLNSSLNSAHDLEYKALPDFWVSAVESPKPRSSWREYFDLRMI